jgi:hypothetical protein
MGCSFPLLGLLSIELAGRDLGVGELPGVSSADWSLLKQVVLWGEKRDIDYGMPFATVESASREVAGRCWL